MPRERSLGVPGPWLYCKQGGNTFLTLKWRLMTPYGLFPLPSVDDIPDSSSKCVVHDFYGLTISRTVTSNATALDLVSIR